MEDFQSKKTVLYTVVASAISEAICYSLKRWDRLSRYCEDGMLNIDNNAVEKSIRPVAPGRKNYLFCGSHEAAKRSAMLYSPVCTCELHGHNLLPRFVSHEPDFRLEVVRETRTKA